MTNALNNDIMRAFIGIDRLLEMQNNKLFINQMESNYPPINIIKHDNDHYEIEIAVTGFTKDEVTVKVENDQLTVIADKIRDPDYVEPNYIRRGLATRRFERMWNLDGYMQVVEASMLNGMLTIKIERILPDHLKPRTVEIKG